MTERNAGTGFAPVVSLFFAWGFLAANNDPLVAALRAIFRLSYTEALLTQIVSFMAFGLISLPAARLLAWTGPARTIIFALCAMIAGCLIIQGTRIVHDYRLVLAGLFVAGGGITTLQVAANPIAAFAGPPEGSHFRLTLAQFFNSLGMICGVYFGARMILRGGLHDLRAVQDAFLMLAGGLALLAAGIWHFRRAILSAAARVPASTEDGISSAFRSRWALTGAAAIAFYVGAEVTIGSLMINFLAAPERLGLSLAEAGYRLAAFYWGGALAGRLLGALLMIRVPAARLLVGAATITAALCAVALAGSGPLAAYAALSIGLFNAIMFPTIFALTLERSQASVPATSGLLCLGIAFGAPVPLLAAQIADRIGIAFAFSAPLAAYLYILLFALLCARQSSGVLSLAKRAA